MIKQIFLILISLTILNATNNISQKAFNTISEANNLVEKNELSKAKKLIEPMLLDSNNDYEKSYLLQTLSNIYLLQNNYDKTINIYNQIIKLNQFEKETIDMFKASLARLYLSTNKYKQSFELAITIIDSPSIKKDELYETIIYSSYYLKDYKNTIKYSNMLLNQTTTKSESIYKIIYSSYVEMKDLKGAIVLMDMMVKKWDKNEDYWMQLASLYEQTNNIDKAISTLEIIYKANVLSNKNNVLYFVNLLLQKQLYSKSSKVFEKYFANNILEKDEKNFEIYISSLMNSKDYDKAINEIKSSNFANNDKINILLANLYYIKEEYQLSIKTLENNIKYSEKKEGEKHLLLGINYYELNDKTKSLYHLKKASQYTYTKAKANSIIKELKLSS